MSARDASFSPATAEALAGRRESSELATSSLPAAGRQPESSSQGGGSFFFFQISKSKFYCENKFFKLLFTCICFCNYRREFFESKDDAGIFTAHRICSGAGRFPAPFLPVSPEQILGSVAKLRQQFRSKWVRAKFRIREKSRE